MWALARVQLQLRNLRCQKNRNLKKSAMKPTRLRQSVLQESRLSQRVSQQVCAALASLCSKL
jgi:hypothetical protein